MDIWIYRPDKEAVERRINKNFTYNCRGKMYWDCYDERKEQKSEIKRLAEIRYKEIVNHRMEVPNE